MNQSTKMMAQLGALVLVAAGLGGYAYFGVFKKDQAQTQKKAIEEKLFATAKVGDAPVLDGGELKTEFTRLSVSTKDQTTVLEREVGGQWRIVSPVKTDVDALVVDALTSQLQQAKFKSTLDENPSEADLVKYGLTPPEFAVEATARVGASGEARSVKLEGGIENTFDGSIYMRRDGQKAVYLAEGGVRWSLAKTTFDLRKKEILGLDEGQLKAIDVVAKANSYRLERTAEQGWQVVKPAASAADATVVAGMVGQLKAVKATRFLPEATAMVVTTTAVFTTTEGQTVKLELGKAAADAGTGGYARRTDERGTVVAEIAAAQVTNLDRNPLDFRDKTIVTFKKELVTRLQFHGADGQEFSVVQEPSTAGIASWSVTGARSGPAKTFKVTSVLWVLSTFKGSAFADDKVMNTGLDAKARFIALFGADGAELARFTIGREVPGKVNIFYVKGTRPQVIEVDGSRFNELPSTPDELLEGADAGR